MRTYADIEYKDGLDLTLFLPDEENFSLFVYFHGGGLEHSTKNGCKVFASTLCKNGIGVATINYRMYPNAKYPDFIEDAALAVRFVKSEISEYCRYDKLIVSGTSAGGYLTQMLCFDARWLGKHGLCPTDVDAFIHDAGQPTAHFNVLKERGIDPRRVIVDESAPLYHVGEAESYPPMQIIVSDNDMASRLEQTELLISTLRHFGYDMKNVLLTMTEGRHVWYVTKTDENGHNEFANIIIPFIKNLF
jgi:acetyl esterase/lipase